MKLSTREAIAAFNETYKVYREHLRTLSLDEVIAAEIALEVEAIQLKAKVKARHDFVNTISTERPPTKNGAE